MSEDFIAQRWEPERGWMIAKSGILTPDYLSYRVFGEAADQGNVYGNAFTYLYTRFGPSGPFDTAKQLGAYYLTTPDLQVRFWMTCSPSKGMSLEAGHCLAPDIYERIAQDYRRFKTWKEARPEMGIYGGFEPPEGTAARHASDMIEAGLRDMLRPVYVRDMAINILGRAEDVGLPEAVESYWLLQERAERGKR